MLEILKYIFSSFWVFSGTVVLIWSIGIMLTLIFYAIFGDSKKKYPLIWYNYPAKLRYNISIKGIGKWREIVKWKS